MASLLRKYFDANQWDAEDIAGRLGMVFHAAFLFASFQPYGAQPRSGHLLKKQSRKKRGCLCLSRRYTVPDLAHREGADAAVLMLCVQGNDVVLQVFLTADGDDVLENAYMERLDLGTMRRILFRGLGGVEPWASRICKALADGVCWGLFDELCRRNGLPLSAFESLPDDLKGAILAKLTDGKDLARVECVSSQLRLFIAERDHELWKTLYKALPMHQSQGWLRLWWSLHSADESSDEETLSVGLTWKDKYLEVRRRSRPMFSWYFDSFDPIPMIHRSDMFSWPDEDYWFIRDLPEEEKTVPPRVNRSGGGHRRKLARNDYKKNWHGGSAIHSPSSRYRWKHR